MGTERPTAGMLTFQCDVCYDTREFSRDQGEPVGDYRACWAVLRESGWRVIQSEHLCEDCARIAETDTDRKVADVRFARTSLRGDRD